jgi:hypothetical protein
VGGTSYIASSKGARDAITASEKGTSRTPFEYRIACKGAEGGEGRSEQGEGMGQATGG